MSADWVAASVRARAMARRRAGAGACRRAAAAADLPTAIAVFAQTPAGDRLAGCATVAEADRAGTADLVWSMRVLAGWIPARGTTVVRALAAGVERSNVVALAAALGAGPGPGEVTGGAAAAATAARDAAQPEVELGALATAWPRLRAATSTAQLRAELRRSPWGDPGEPADLPDVLGAVWMRRLAGEVPATRPWVRSAAGVVVARRLLLGSGPSPRLVSVLRPLVGDGWPRARTLDALREALPRSVTPALADVTGPGDLWRAEAGLRARVQADAFAMLRRATPGPDVVVGAIAVLAVDAWRVRAALAAAAAGGTSEVLDAVA